MKNNYIRYTANQLLADSYFLESEQHPTPESIAFWQNLEYQDEAFAKEITLARSFLYDIKHIQIPQIPQDDAEKLWGNISRLNKKEKVRRRKIRIAYRSISVAASIALVIGLGWYLYRPTVEIPIEHSSEILAVKKPDNIPSDNIQLIISEEKQIAIDGKEGNVQYDPQGNVSVNSETLALDTETKDKSHIYNQLIVPAGKRSSVTLADGTLIWVSANSRVVYPVEFARDKREIFVEGEAYFDVFHDSDRPFIVKTDQMNIQVLGTVFNVCAHKNKESQTVVLVNGKIEVIAKGNDSKILVPNDLLTFHTQDGITVKPVDVEKYIAWKDGYYVFRQDELEYITQKLSEYYGKEIHIDEKLKNLTYSGKLDLKNDLKDVLRTLVRTLPAVIENSDENIFNILVKH